MPSPLAQALYITRQHYMRTVPSGVDNNRIILTTTIFSVINGYIVNSIRRSKINCPPVRCLVLNCVSTFCSFVIFHVCVTVICKLWPKIRYTVAKCKTLLTLLVQRYIQFPWNIHVIFYLIEKLEIIKAEVE